MASTDLITEDYREQNKLLHASDRTFGVGARKKVGLIKALEERYGTRDILDYGCGKKDLQGALGYPIQNYDPCVDGCDGEPRPAKLLVSLDVLEHVEPNLLDNVLKHMSSLMLEAGLLIIAPRLSSAILPNGKNAHRIVEGKAWWVEQVSKYFTIEHVSPKEQDVIIYVKPLC
ncbi:MAG TPA: hypothetical protein VJ742_07235 [Nitrososphaera sp.]|nr:hypothetical protein [Nitrososphaera sp.]